METLACPSASGEARSHPPTVSCPVLIYQLERYKNPKVYLIRRPQGRVESTLIRIMSCTNTGLSSVPFSTRHMSGGTMPLENRALRLLLLLGLWPGVENGT